MESLKIGINGFGRIGRMIFRAAINDPRFEIVAVNDLYEPKYLAYMLKYDSTHGAFDKEIQVKNDQLIVNGQSIKVSSEKNPSHISWGELGDVYAIEATGLFLDSEKANQHLIGGARKVILSAPPKDNTPVFVMGVNHETYSSEMRIVSNASCTTNCLAPLVKVLNDHFGVRSGIMSTVHAATATQRTIDGPSSKDWRSGRGAYQNIIPSSTGAASAVGKVIPELNGMITGTSYRVPLANVSVVDLTVNLKKATSYEEIKSAMLHASKNEMTGILGYTEELVVSSDFNGDSRTSVFDASAGLMLGNDMAKVVGWYDNETGYSHKLLDLAWHMHHTK